MPGRARECAKTWRHLRLYTCESIHLARIARQAKATGDAHRVNGLAGIGARSAVLLCQGVLWRVNGDDATPATGPKRRISAVRINGEQNENSQHKQRDTATHVL